MNFEDFFDKQDGQVNYRGRSFDRSDPFSSPPMVDEPPSMSRLSAFFMGLTSVILLSITEGTLAWVIFESLEDMGFLDRRIPWQPFVVIALCVNLIRAFDRAVFVRR